MTPCFFKVGSERDDRDERSGGSGDVVLDAVAAED
jgi:hypothetical protein